MKTKLLETVLRCPDEHKVLETVLQCIDPHKVLETVVTNVP